MELYVFGVGVISSLKQWADDLQACWLPYGKKGKKPTHMIRLGVGEVKLYKLMFPKEALDNVMGVLGEGGYIEKYPEVASKIKWIRKLLHLKETPKPTKIYKHMMPNKINKAVAIIPIGTREDEICGDGKENI